MGTIKTTNIEPIADNGTVTLGSSGDTFTVPSGVTITNSGTATGFGEANTPNFLVYGIDQAMSDNTTTKLQFNSEAVDSDSAYDTSNYRFTVPSGKGGLYCFNTTYRFEGGMLSQINLNFRKNGSDISSFYTYSGGVGTAIYNSQQYVSRNLTLFENCSAGDYIEVFAFFDIISGSTLQCDTRQGIGQFSGFRITS
jgi:hypothetical protein